MSRRFVGKACLVAGSADIARRVSERLTAEGGAVARILTGPGQTIAESNVRTEIALATRSAGEFDVAVTAFASQERVPFLQLDEASWTLTMHSILKASFLVGRECARRMVSRGGGVIVHVGSDLGLRPAAGTAAYAAAIAGIHSLAACMALDLAPSGVRVCAVAIPEAEPEPAPGAHPDLADAAAAVAFCASDDASYVVGSTLSLTRLSPSRWP
jgi:NAD(P)-dependent dehydrogenase (short-subunit alcohol dehydrogenase family)